MRIIYSNLLNSVLSFLSDTDPRDSPVAHVIHASIPSQRFLAMVAMMVRRRIGLTAILVVYVGKYQRRQKFIHP